MAKPFDPFKLYEFTFNDDGYFSSCLVPKRLGVCPNCESRLWIECGCWERGDQDSYWIPIDVELDCVRGMECWKESQNSEPNRMPYVYWLPLHMDAEEWLQKMLRVYYGVDPVPQKWLERNGQQRFKWEVERNRQPQLNLEASRT